MKSEEEKRSFVIGMGTTIMASYGSRLFNGDGWSTYIGLFFMICSAILVYSYIKK
jgi:hypothetical protein